MTSTSSSVEKYTNVIENSKMNSNEENTNTSSGYNQRINKNVVDTLPTAAATTTTSAVITTNVISSSNSASPSDLIVNTNTAPNTAAASNKNSARSNPAGSIKDLDNLNEHQLKELLDEAFSYKNPKDRENKSETFRQMLENVEQEKDRIPSKHGGSLQDLVEAQAVHNDLILDYEYTYNNRNRRHHHNSRPKKYCSLVSTRQREGGSLPSNVNVSNCNLTVYEPSFLNEVLNKRRIGVSSSGGGVANNSGGNKNERAVSATSCNSATSGNSSNGGVHHDLTSGKDNDLISNSGSNGGNNSADTVIDIGENYTDEKHLLVIDSSKKGYTSSMEDDCIEIGIQLNNNKKNTPRAPGFNAAHQGKLEHTAPEPRHYVDEPITFAALERGKTIVDTTCLPLNENYPSCKSLMGDKSELVKPLYTSTKNITKQCDENGNSLNSAYNNTTSTTSQSQAKAKKKKSQSDRNTKTYNVTSVAGYRGEDPVDVLVKYIENTEDDKKNDKTNNKLNENKRKDKKKDKENNNNKKFKKSNSLEELRSCTKLDEDEKQEIVGNINVTMRNKTTNKQNKYNINNNNINNSNIGCGSGAVGIGSNICSSSTSSNCSTQSNSTEIKENFKQQQINHHKRGERRSWGTEELNYLGENNAIEEVREKAKDKEKKKSKDVQQITTATVQANFNSIEISSLSFQQNDNKMNKKKQDPISLSRISIDSLQCESAAEFHVVTKKKKSKKRQTNSEEFNNRNSTGGLSTGGYSNNNNNNKFKDAGGANNFGNQNKRYQITGNFSNDRDLYLHSFNTNKDKKSRRKSTSSMPPSEKSDSSDLESVHSLPIESTTSSSSITRNNNNNNQSAHTTKSYADMARSNAAAAAAAEAAANSALGDKLDKWPTVSGGNESSSSTGSGNGGVGGGGNGASGNVTIKNMSHKKSSVTNKDFPELLLSDKLNNNDSNIKPISYSQRLTTTEDRKYNHQSTTAIVPLVFNEKCNSNIATGIKSPTLKPSTVTVASMTDGFLRSNEIKTPPITFNIGGNNNKQLLQKSKSVETDYNSMDQYPALEKTIKRHITPASIITTATTILTHQSQQQQNIVNVNNSQLHNVIPIISHQLQQQQQQPTIIGTLKQTPKSVFTNLPNTVIPFTANNNNTIIPNVGNLSIIQSQQLLHTNDKSKIIIISPTTTVTGNLITTNNLVLAGNTITSATSSSNNLSQNIINNTNNNNINIGKKSLIKQLNNNNQLNNAKVIDNISFNLESSSLLSPTTIIQSTNDQLIQNSNIDNNNTIINNNQQLTNRKISKNVATVTTNIYDGQTAIASGGINNNNNQNCRNKYKRGEKNQQFNLNKHQEKLCNSLLASSSTTTNQHKNQQNITSRPAVIILNDDSSSLAISSEFTFGDFKEEELRFYNSSGNINNNNINENCNQSSGNIVVSGNNTQGDTIISSYSTVGNNITSGIYGNTTTLSQLSNNDNSLDDSGAQFSFGSIGNIDTAINCNIVMNSTDIINDNEQQSQQQQHQHNLSSPNSDYGYSSLSVNNRSGISDDNSIDISNKLSSTAHDIENNNSILQDIDDSITTTTKLGITSNNNNTISNNILISNHRDDNDDDNNNNKEMLAIKNCNQQGIKQSASCSPIKQSLENTKKSSTSSSIILSNTLLLSTAASSSGLDSNKNIISNNDIDKINNITATNTAAITSTTGHQQFPNTNRNNNRSNNNSNSENQRRSIKEINVRYVAPSQELNSMNFDKIIDFVGLAWEEIAHGNRGTQFYNGQ